MQKGWRHALRDTASERNNKIQYEIVIGAGLDQIKKKNEDNKGRPYEGNVFVYI